MRRVADEHADRTIVPEMTVACGHDVLSLFGGCFTAYG